jgi:hypothetical protein
MVCFARNIFRRSATPILPLDSVHARRSNGPGENDIARTAPCSRPGLEVVKTFNSESTFSSRSVATSKIDMIPYCVATAKYFPEFEKHAAKDPLIVDLSDCFCPSNPRRPQFSHR